MLLSICILILGTSRKCWWSVCWVCAWSVLACVGASDHFITGRNDLTTLSHGHLFCPRRTCRKKHTQMHHDHSEWINPPPHFEFEVDFECSFKIKIFMPLIIKLHVKNVCLKQNLDYFCITNSPNLVVLFCMKCINCHFVTIWTWHATYYEFHFLMISFSAHSFISVHLLIFFISIPKLFCSDFPCEGCSTID